MQESPLNRKTGLARNKAPHTLLLTLMKLITQTTNCKSVAVARILIALPLLLSGSQHLFGLAPMEPILRGAKIPFPELNAIVAPLIEVTAGLLLLLGFFARIGAALTIPAMSVALYTHLVFDWADEPPILLPIALIVLAAYILWRGAGAWSLDLRKQS